MLSLFFLGLSLAGQSSAAELQKRWGDNTYYEILNDDLARITLLVLGMMAAFMYVWKLGFRFSDHLRRLASFNSEQRYFVTPNATFAKVKNHLIYAALFRTRHNREFQLSSAINMGTLPSRFHGLLIFGIVVMNIVLCVVTVPYKKDEQTVSGIIRNRTGTMATVNLIPLVLMAGRNNPLITLLQVPFDTWNLLHRWLGRIVVLESLAHIFAFVLPEAWEAGWTVVGMMFKPGSMFMLSGLIAGCAFTGLMLHSPSPIRHAFYETFLHLHIAMVVIAFAFLWVHLNGHIAQKFLLGSIVFWAFERAMRLGMLLYRNVDRKCTKAVVEAMPGDAMRITLSLARPWTFKPGQHIYLYIPAVGWWSSHPFSVGWSDSEEQITDEKGIPMTRQEVASLQKTTLSLLVRRRTGFTDKLFQRAQNSPDSRVTLRAFAEGPYGSIHSMDSYGTVLLFAGGVGITHHVPFVRHLVKGYAEGTVAARRITLVWIIQSPEHLEWIRPWMTSILAMDRRREVLRIMLFITRPRNTKEIQSPSATVQMFPGRPNVDTLVGMEVENQVGAMGVLVCGNGGLSDDVRRTCRKRQNETHVDYIEESFSW
ncbi:hypothetical protein ASPWEDRAFT_49259 [Aspergillus wentii DTO 134E9]|uniref:ferric-chelate reductase (NADPH) n=1 Tax=Aspergillus wentii DTO 134E9 TaxID=1073089 RepID=A0A1L9RWB0_ASPWE|nr:uncharacterized protein ASPWEDRAFT_49259 [Aspergillus wentii DTO 134E9]KAI9929087.1 hypothetical protein MW887_001491 [Aspergillus wentii]OJJ39219.1 hypothetical protein ASPWEDRAFT_49259 [Aspergillus wentii DTO 134E9]